MSSLDRAVRQRPSAAPRRDHPVPSAGWDPRRGALPAWNTDLTALGHELDIAGGGTELRWLDSPREPGRQLCATRQTTTSKRRGWRQTTNTGEYLGALTQVPVDLATQIGTDTDLHGPRGSQPRQHDRESRDGRDPRTQSHGSRNTYPTPHTVWISARAPTSSSLRRR